ncbi:TonB-dependent siderophore receptor [Bradyrhizobium sp. BR 10289]|uniref:TonB-dependent siderophore receptor n=1 Tax=Bradyrhizobium sp. BR 10289 TaxID=2749993 RepID=UPI0032DEAF04
MGILEVGRWRLAGAVSSVVLTIVSGGAAAQSSAAGSTAGAGTELVPVIVQASAAPKRINTSSARSRNAARARAAARASVAASAAAAAAAGAGAGAGRKESAFGHVDGMVATRSGTGTKTDTPLIETPVAISVVTQDQIQAQGAQSVSQAVRYTSGVRAEAQGADARFDQIYIRGFLADQYLDSLRLMNASIFAYPIIEPFNLERVEILHGPASVLYGQASPGGVVDLVSKRPTLEPYHEMFVSTGSYGRAQAGVDLSGPIDKNKEFLYRFTASGFDVGSQVNHTGYQRVSIAPSLTWRPDNQTTFTVLGTYQRDPKAGFFNLLPANGTVFPAAGGAKIPTSFYSGEPGFDKTDRTVASIGYLFEHRFNNVLTVRQNLRYMDNSTDFAVVSPTGSNPFSLSRGVYTTYETLRSLALDNQGEFKFKAGPLDHTALLGIDYRNSVDTALNRGTTTGVPAINAFDPVYGLPLPTPPVTSYNRQRLEQVGFYGQDQVKLGGFVALLGLRYDQADLNTDNLLASTTAPKSDGALTKRAALLYKFDNGVAPYVQYTESFQPRLGTNFFGQAFKPTRGQQEEVGVKYQPDPKTLLTLAAFNLEQQNVLTPDPDPTHIIGGVRSNVQTGKVRSRGVELEGKSEINRNLTMLGAYTYTELVNTESNTTNLGKRVPGIPLHAASLWADYTFHGGALDGFGLSGGVRYLGAAPGNSLNTFDVPATTLFDLGMHYDLAALGPQFKGFLASVNATNLFDKTYVEVCQDTGCYYGLRRNVIATLRYKW